MYSNTYCPVCQSLKICYKYNFLHVDGFTLLCNSCKATWQEFLRKPYTDFTYLEYLKLKEENKNQKRQIEELERFIFEHNDFRKDGQ